MSRPLVRAGDERAGKAGIDPQDPFGAAAVELGDAELVGARVEVREPATHALLGTRIVFSNHGYKTCNALEAHFGLGRRDVVEVKATLLNGKTSHSR